MLAAAVMVIAVTGIGNAFAYMYSGTDQSNNNGNIYWWSNAGGSPSVAKGEMLYWENGFYNVGTTAYYAALVYSGSSPKFSPQLGQYGYWWPNTASVQASQVSGDWSFYVQHYWSTNPYSFSNPLQTTHPYHVN